MKTAKTLGKNKKQTNKPMEGKWKTENTRWTQKTNKQKTNGVGRSGAVAVMKNSGAQKMWSCRWEW